MVAFTVPAPTEADTLATSGSRLTMSETADFLYKTTDYWYPQHERTLLWNDPALGIEWPLDVAPKVAPKDATGTALAKADLYP